MSSRRSLSSGRRESTPLCSASGVIARGRRNRPDPLRLRSGKTPPARAVPGRKASRLTVVWPTECRRTSQSGAESRAAQHHYLMSNLVFVTGDFCSGSTAVFTLFRKTGQYYCLYEPLHDKLREYLLYDLRPESTDNHFFVDSYYREFRGFKHARSLFNPKWGTTQLRIPPEAEADDLYRYLNYVIGSAFGRAPRVMFKENRLAFRLGWIRAKFPERQNRSHPSAQRRPVAVDRSPRSGAQGPPGRRAGFRVIQRLQHRRILRGFEVGVSRTRREPLLQRLQSFFRALDAFVRRESQVLRYLHRLSRPPARFREHR